MNWRALGWLGIVVAASSAGCHKEEPAAAVDAAPVDVAPAVPPVPEIASKQVVRFHLPTRPGGTLRLFLPGMVIARVDDAGVTKLVADLPPDCPCAPCPAVTPPPAGPSVADIEWDARAYTVVPYARKCPNGQEGKGVRAALQPLPPGHYRVSFLVTPCAKPPKGADAAAECRETSPRPVDADFELAESGGMDVSVP